MSEVIPPTSKSATLTDEQIQRYDADSRIELIAECERLRAAVNEGAMGCCQIVKEDMTAEIERLRRERDEAELRFQNEVALTERLNNQLAALSGDPEQSDETADDLCAMASAVWDGGVMVCSKCRRPIEQTFRHKPSETAPLPCYWPNCDCKQAVNCKSRPSEKASDPPWCCLCNTRHELKVPCPSQNGADEHV